MGGKKERRTYHAKTRCTLFGRKITPGSRGKGPVNELHKKMSYVKIRADKIQKQTNKKQLQN